jgi:heme/copper-type cytochrome/quinol oxidase subunit 2
MQTISEQRQQLERQKADLLAVQVQTVYQMDQKIAAIEEKERQVRCTQYQQNCKNTLHSLRQQQPSQAQECCAFVIGIVWTIFILALQCCAVYALAQFNSPSNNAEKAMLGIAIVTVIVWTICTVVCFTGNTFRRNILTNELEYINEGPNLQYAWFCCLPCLACYCGYTGYQLWSIEYRKQRLSEIVQEPIERI